MKSLHNVFLYTFGHRLVKTVTLLNSCADGGVMLKPAIRAEKEPSL